MMPLNRTCRDVAALLVAKEDRTLPITDRLALRIHMAICEACPRFERQLLIMRNSMQMWRGYTTTDEPNNKESLNSPKT
jgi:hypothetical protein